MTQVIVQYTRPSPDGPVPMGGAQRWKPTKRRSVAGTVITPLPFRVEVAGTATLDDVTPTGPDWAWRVDEFVGGTVNTIYVMVPDIDTPQLFSDLVQVDPDTFEVVTAIEPAWYAYVTTLEAAASTSASAAQEAKASAEVASAAVTDAVSGSGENASIATQKASEASASAVTASTHATSAGDSASTADGHRVAAENAGTGAEAARANAQVARTGAENARTGAEAARDAAGVLHSTTVKSGVVDAAGNLTLTRNDNTTVAAGNVKGPIGNTGPAGGVNSIDGRQGDVALGIPQMSMTDIRTPIDPRKATSTAVNGGVALWNPEISALINNAYYRLKFAAGQTNVWYINLQNNLGTRAAVRGKSLVLRFEEKDLSATSLKNAAPLTVAINKAGDWGPGSYFTVVNLTDTTKVTMIGPNLYRFKIDDFVDPAMLDTDPVNLNIRIYNGSGTSTTSTYHYSTDFWYRAVIMDGAMADFSTVATVAGKASILDGFTDDPRRFAAKIASSSVNYGGSGGSTLALAKEELGLTQRWTRPQTTQPDNNWNYHFAYALLGTVANLKGKKYFFRFDDSLSEMKTYNNVGIGKNFAQWAQVKFPMDATTFWTQKDGDELYALCKAAGLLDTDTAYFLGGSETRAATTPAINWEIGAAVREKGASKQSILIADGVADAPDLSTYATKAYVDAKQPAYITCWGDSLTAGGGWTTTLSTDLGLTVNNAGTGGENTNTIVARQGGDVMMVNNITIPAAATAVQIATYQTGITTFLGKKAMPLLQGGTSHVNPVKIGNIEGTLTFTGTSYADTTGVYTFTRALAGTETVVNRPTAIRTKADRDWNDGLMIAFIGQNGGHTDDADLINRHKLMKAHYKGRSKMVVLGLSSGTEASRAAYEAAMTLEFGRYFISLRKYLSTYGIADAGLVATQADLDAMAVGSVPPQLLTDSVHFTTACKTVIGKMLVLKLRELQLVTT